MPELSRRGASRLAVADMDASRHLPCYLTAAEVRRRDGYVGEVAEVVEAPLRNRFRAETETKLVIVFATGERLVPGVRVLRTLIAAWGAKTDAWRGRSLRLTVGEVTDGKGRTRYERRMTQA